MNVWVELCDRMHSDESWPISIIICRTLAVKEHKYDLSVFSPAYIRHVGPTSFQYRIFFGVGTGESKSYDVVTSLAWTMPSCHVLNFARENTVLKLKCLSGIIIIKRSPLMMVTGYSFVKNETRYYKCTVCISQLVHLISSRLYDIQVLPYSKTNLRCINTWPLHCMPELWDIIPRFSNYLTTFIEWKIASTFGKDHYMHML